MIAVPSYYSDTSVVFVNGDCTKLEFENFDKLFGSDEFKSFSLPVGNRTKTHDTILNIDEVGARLKDRRVLKRNRKFGSSQAKNTFLAFQALI